MPITILDDPFLIQKVCEMKETGLFVSDIAKILSDETGMKITQISICRLLNAQKTKSPTILTELDYPSRNEIEEVFSEHLQKQENRICIHGGKQLKRNVMIEILTKFIKLEFTYMDVSTSLYKTADHESIYQHWRYLLDGHYIIKTENEKFKFCERVKKWKYGMF